MAASTILVVEDNPITRKMVRVALETEGHTVLEAEDGAAALARMAAGRVDLVLQDLLLPDMDGRDLVRLLRAMPSGATIPILAFSGFLTNLEQEQGAPSGFTDFIYKPVDVGTLLETVRVYLQVESASTPAPNPGPHVLIADDDPTSLKLLRLQLQQSGFRVSTANDGASALEEARKLRPDIIVADVLMPRMDGFRFCRALRDDPELAHLPVVLYSAAYTDVADQDLACHVGANALLPRSVDLRELTETLLREIGSAAPQVSSGPAETSEEYTFRVIRQLEAQVRLNATVNRRVALLEAKLAVFAGLAETLQRTSDPEAVLGELLPCCLEAAQLSRGALFILDEAGTPRLRAHLGYSPAAAGPLDDCFGSLEWLGKVLAGGEPVHLAPDADGPEEAAGLLARMEAAAALVVPITVEGRSLGGLLLASADRELTDNWPLFARALGSQIGQSLALTQAITQRKIAETALREGEQRFRALADPMPQMIWTAGADGIIDYANRRWIEYAGHAIRDAQAGGWAAVVHGEDLEALDQQWRSSVETGKPLELEVRLKRATDGTYRWHTLRALPFRSESAEIVRWYGSITDIDDRIRALEELAEADRRKDQFLAMLAHELRNPLSAISSAIHVMHLADSNTPAFARARAIAARQVLQQTRMVDDLLDVSRITRGKVELRPEAVELVALLEDCLEDHRADVERSGLELHVSLPEPPLVVHGDRARLGQVFANLLHNSVKFSTRGGTVEISLATEPAGSSGKPTDGSACHAVVRIRDTGIGIPPELLPHVFETFRQADTSLDRARGGLGMGLALVKGLVELHGGSVEAHSPGPDRGTVVTVRLPVAVGVAAPTLPQVLLPLREAPAAGGLIHLLIVEDNADAAESLRCLLEEAGHEVVVAHSGPAALQAARQLVPVVVICDIGLPGMDGYEVAQALRRDTRTACARLIALTGYGGVEDKERARVAGFDLHLTKPVDPEALIHLISGMAAGVTAL